MGEMLKVEKGITVPRVRRYTKYPFDKMEVGDSFYCDGATRNSIASSASRYARNKGQGKKFTIRKEGNGCRCWRIA